MAKPRYDSKQTTRFGDKPKNTGYGEYTKDHPSVVPISPPIKKAWKPVKIDKDGNVS